MNMNFANLINGNKALFSVCMLSVVSTCVYVQVCVCVGAHTMLLELTTLFIEIMSLTGLILTEGVRLAGFLETSMDPPVFSSPAV